MNRVTRTESSEPSEARHQAVGCLALIAGSVSALVTGVTLGAVTKNDPVAAGLSAVLVAVLTVAAVATVLNGALGIGKKWNKDLRNPKAWKRPE